MRVGFVEQEVQRLGFLSTFEQIEDYLSRMFWIRLASIEGLEDLHVVFDQKRHRHGRWYVFGLQARIFLDAEAPVGPELVSELLQHPFSFFLESCQQRYGFWCFFRLGCEAVLFVLEAQVTAEQALDLWRSLLEVRRRDLEDQPVFGRMCEFGLERLRGYFSRLARRPTAGVVPALGRFAPVSLELGSLSAVWRKAQSVVPEHQLIIKFRQ